MNIIEKQTSDNSFKYNIASEENNYNAYVIIEHFNNEVWIDLLYVSTVYRRKGYATALMNKVISIADRLKRNSRLVLASDGPLSTKELAAFYGRFGFKPTIDHGISGEMFRISQPVNSS